MLCLQNSAPRANAESLVVVSVEAHADFFRRLIRDEDFRQELQARPLETLTAYGIHLDPSLIPSSVQLPDANTVAIIMDPGEERIWAGFF